MKKLLLPLFLLGGLFAHADIVVEQKIESAQMNGNMVMKIKGDQARMDMPKTAAGEMSVVMDFKTGNMTVLIHGQKMAMKQNLDAAKKQAEAQQKASGIDPAKIEKPKSTGKKEKVGDWDTEIFETTMADSKVIMWVAKDFPNYKTVQDQLNKLSAATGGGGGFDPSKFDLGGMIVKTEMNMPAAGGKVVSTLVKAKEEAVADSEFKLPADYQTIGQ